MLKAAATLGGPAFILGESEQSLTVGLWVLSLLDRAGGLVPECLTG